jgi:hypothetical protein
MRVGFVKIRIIFAHKLWFFLIWFHVCPVCKFSFLINYGTVLFIYFFTYFIIVWIYPRELIKNSFIWKSFIYHYFIILSKFYQRNSIWQWFFTKFHFEKFFKIIKTILLTYIEFCF